MDDPTASPQKIGRARGADGAAPRRSLGRDRGQVRGRRSYRRIPGLRSLRARTRTKLDRGKVDQPPPHGSRLQAQMLCAGWGA